MASFGFFSDAGLTTPLATLAAAAAVDGSTGAVVRTVYFGSPTAGRTLRAASNPGVDSLALGIVDAAAGSGTPAADVTLGLDSSFTGRTAGSALNLGVQVNGGVANAVPIWVKWVDSTHVLGVNSDITLTMNDAQET